MNGSGVTAKMTFSGEVQTREPVGMIITGGQSGLSAPVPFFFNGNLLVEPIGDICLAENAPSNLRISGKSLIITSAYRGWGYAKIILFDEYPKLKWTIEN